MPNWCYNRITVYADEDTANKIAEIKEIFETKQPFNTLFPQPDWKNTPLAESDQYQYSFSSKRGEIGELPVESGEKFKGLHFASTGIQDDRWYDWRNQNWGTKWDAYSMEIDESEMPHGLQVEFETAWCPPEEVCNAIREQYDDLSISWFYDEPGCEIAGYY